MVSSDKVVVGLTSGRCSGYVRGCLAPTSECVAVAFYRGSNSGLVAGNACTGVTHNRVMECVTRGRVRGPSSVEDFGELNCMFENRVSSNGRCVFREVMRWRGRKVVT